MQSYKLQNQTSLHVINTKGKHAIFHDTTIVAIQKILAKKQKVIIFINKQGVHTGMICKECWHIPYCKNCDIPIALHHNTHHQLFGLCPVCQETYATITQCPACVVGKMWWYGIGIQQVADHCQQLFGIYPLIIQSSSANSFSKVDSLLKAATDAEIILSTSLMQSWIVENIGLVISQNALSVASPDFNTEYNNFQFLHTIVHRFKTPHILLQTSSPDHLIIQSFIEEKPHLFLDHDMLFRQRHHYPPYGELCIMIHRNEVESALLKKVSTIFHDMLALKQSMKRDDIEIYAIPAAIYKMYSKYRYQIIIKWPEIRSFMDEVYSQLCPFAKWFKIDRGAQSFL